MAKLVCSSCGAEYPANWFKAWGKHFLTHGHGPAVKCTELVPNGLIAPLPDNQTDEQCPMSKRQAMQVCGGPLMPDKGSPAEGRPVWLES